MWRTSARATFAALLIWGASASTSPALQHADTLERRVEAARNLSVSTQSQEALSAWTAILTELAAAGRTEDVLYAQALEKRSSARFYSGDPTHARLEADEAIAILERLGDQDRPIIAALVWRGVLGALTGDLDGGRADFERAETLIGEADPAADPLMIEIQAGLANIDRRAGRWEALAARVEPLLPGLASLEPGHIQRLTLRMSLAEAQAQTGRRTEALDNYRTAYRESLTHRGADSTFTVLAAESLGMFELTQGNDVEADRILSASLRQRRNGVGVPFELAAAKGMNGLAALSLDRPAAAEALFLDSRDGFSTVIGPTSRPVMINLRNAAAAAAAQGRHTEASRYLTEALEISRGLPGNALTVAQIQSALAVEEALIGNGDAARTLSEAALNALEARRQGDPDRIQVAIVSAWVMARDGDVETSRRTLREILPHLEADLERRLAVGGAPAPPRDLRIALGRGLETAWLTDDIETGFRIAQLLIESDASRAAVAAQARLVQRDDDLAGLLRRRQGLALTRQSLDRRYLQAVGGGASPDVASLAEEIQASDAAFRELGLLIQTRYPQAEAVLPALPLTVAEARSRLGAGEAMVMPVLSPDEVVVFVLTPTETRWSKADLSPSDIVALVARVRGSIQTGYGLRDAVDASQPMTSRPPVFDLDAGRRLRAGLLGGALSDTLSKADTLIFATGRELSRLPWAALAGSTTATAPDWLIETWAVQTAPSVRSLRADTRAEPAPERLFGIGAPTSLAFPADGGEVAAKTLPPLPGARVELRALAAAFPRSEIHMEDDASKARLIEADLTETDILVFATHGLLSGDAPGLTEPALLMASQAGAPEGAAYLTASEVALLDLDAGWVVLSACDTAAPGRPGAGGFTGLAQAFLFAGARRVMASHWPVRDDVAARMTLDVTREAAAGRTPAQALRAAMLSVLQDATVTGGSDPAVWAPFALIGS